MVTHDLEWGIEMTNLLYFLDSLANEVVMGDHKQITEKDLLEILKMLARWSKE